MNLLTYSSILFKINYDFSADLWTAKIKLAMNLCCFTVVKQLIILTGAGETENNQSVFVCM